MWSLIESAPKIEGRRILLWDGEVHLGEWDDTWGWVSVETEIGGWGDDVCQEHVSLQPTHWATLPEGPQ